MRSFNFPKTLHAPPDTSLDITGSSPDVPSGPGDNDRPDDNEGIITKTEERVKRPSLFRVVLLNDDYTPMEFVVYVLQNYFHKSVEEATQVMLHVHRRGVGICGIYPLEIAETKVLQVMELAQKESHPLQCQLERE